MVIKKIRTIQTGDPGSITIVLVGCGGTGSFAALNLARLVWSARADKSFKIIFVDPDVVEEKNIGRQYFCPADIGQPKARVLATRLGLAFGLAIHPVVGKFSADLLAACKPDYSSRGTLTLVVGAVDTPAARRDIAEAIRNTDRMGNTWWLDAGNGRTTGQVLIGNSTRRRPAMTEFGDCVEVPLPSVQEPGLVLDAPPAEDDAGLSCAELTALGEQARTINEMMAAWIDVFAERLIVSHDLNLRGVYVNQKQGSVTPAPLNNCVLRRQGGAYPAGYPAATAFEQLAPCPDCGGRLAEGQDEIGGELVDIVFCTACDWQMTHEAYEAWVVAGE